MHTKVSAQQIRSLEMRIARLEKEAGITEFISNIGNKLVNYPRNFIKRVTDALKDVGSQTEILLWGSLGGKKILRESLATQLEIRIRTALQGSISSFKDMPSISKLVVSNPMKSEFIQVVSGRPKKMNVKDLADYYGGLSGKSIKAAYLSWEKDFGPLLDALQGKKPSSGVLKTAFNNFLNFLKRTSKLLYRLMKTVLAVFGFTFFISFDWTSLIVVAGTLIDLTTTNAIPLGTASRGFFELFSNLQGGFIPALLNLIEKAFIKFGVNVDAFDERASKMASAGASYPNIRVALAQLEQI